MVLSGKEEVIEPFGVADILGFRLVLFHSKASPERVEAEFGELSSTRILDYFLLLQQNALMAIKVLDELVKLGIRLNTFRFARSFGLDFQMCIDVVGKENATFPLFVMPNFLDVGDLQRNKKIKTVRRGRFYLRKYNKTTYPIPKLFGF